MALLEDCPFIRVWQCSRGNERWGENNDGDVKSKSGMKLTEWGRARGKKTFSFEPCGSRISHEEEGGRREQEEEEGPHASANPRGKQWDTKIESEARPLARINCELKRDNESVTRQVKLFLLRIREILKLFGIWCTRTKTKRSCVFFWDMKAKQNGLAVRAEIRCPRND